MRAGPPRSTELLKRYGGAVALVGVAFILQFSLSGFWGGKREYLTLLPAVMVTALFGGLGPGLLATALGALLTCYWLLPPQWHFAIHDAADAMALAVFCAMGAGISLVAEFYRRARHKVSALERESAVREMEARVRQESERAVRASEQRLRTLVAATFEGIAVSADGRYTDINEQMARMLGYTREELLGTEIAATLPPEDRPRVLDNIRHGRETHVEHVMLRKDGSPIQVEAHGQTVEFEGRKLRFTAVRDITERKRAERALRESETKYRQVVELMPAAVYTCACDGTVTFYNQRAVALWRRHPQPGERGTQFCGCLQARLASGHPGSLEELPLTVACRAGQSARNVEGIIEGPDNSHIDVLVNIDPMRDPDGHVAGAVIVLTDVTERKRAETALQNQNLRLSLLNEAAAKFLLAEEPDQALVEVYEQIGREFRTSGFFEFELTESGQELQATYCFGFGEPQQECGYPQLKVGEGILGRVAQERQAVVLEHVLDSADPGTEILRHLGVRAYACFPLLVGNRLLGTLSFASRLRDEFGPQDVGFFGTLASYLALAKERLRLQKQLRNYTANLEHAVEERTAKLREAVAELEHMSYSIVHDMRTPLRAVQSFAAIVTRRDGERLSAESRDLLERMMTATTRMDLLITDALNYNKAVRSQWPLETVDVSALLRGMLGSYPEFQPERGEIRLEGEFPPVQANAAGLTQCFSNLLLNALKFTKAGARPRVRVWAEPRGDAVRLWVEDEGIGIPREAQERIFQMFQRAHGPEYEGTGIGLALVRKVVERMGGRVGVESEEGKGSRFWLELAPASRMQSQAAGDGERKLAA